MMTPDVREKIAAEIDDRLDEALGVTVCPWLVEGTAELPAVILGLPDVEFSDWGCSDRVTLGIAVVIAWNTSGPWATARELEELWPVVAEAVRSMTLENPDLDGLVSDCRLVQGVAGDFSVQGVQCPAQLLTLEIDT